MPAARLFPALSRLTPDRPCSSERSGPSVMTRYSARLPPDPCRRMLVFPPGPLIFLPRMSPARLRTLRCSPQVGGTPRSEAAAAPRSAADADRLGLKVGVEAL